MFARLKGCTWCILLRNILVACTTGVLYWALTTMVIYLDKQNRNCISCVHNAALCFRTESQHKYLRWISCTKLTHSSCAKTENIKASGEMNNVFLLPISITSMLTWTEHAASCPLHVMLIITWMKTLSPSGILPLHTPTHTQQIWTLYLIIITLH